MTYDKQNTLQILNAAGVQPLPEQEELLEQYVILLEHWNERVNLISRKDVEDVWRNHILHSLAGLTAFSIPEGSQVLDIGTGGGLPGIPLAIVCPDAEFVLVDSIGKKIRAVSDMIDALGLGNVVAVTGRVEDLVKRGSTSYDIVVTRAVAQLEKLIAWSKPVLTPGTRLYAWKGGDLDDEINRVREAIPGCTIIRHEFQLPGEQYFRNEHKCLIEVQF